MRLIVIEQPELLPASNQPQEFELVFSAALPSLRIGRQLTNDITLLDASVSRQHAELRPAGDIIVVRDLGSRNGTFINNERLAPNSEGFLRLGDQLRLGKAVLLLALSLIPAPVAINDDNPPAQIASEKEDKKSKGYVAQNNGKVSFGTNGHGPGNLKELAQKPSLNDLEKPAGRRDASELPPPEQTELAFQKRIPPVRPRRGLRLGIILSLTLLFLLVVAALIIASMLLLHSPSPTTTKIVLPPNVFASPANGDSALGISVAHPSQWLRREVDASKIIFSPPNSANAAFTVEKAPSTSIRNADSTPEEAVEQYVNDVRRVGQNLRIAINPAPTTLKDGTAAYATKLVFSTDKQPVVTDYTIYVVSFKCDDKLYFVSAGDEGRFYRDTNQQDLEAAVASVACK